MKKYFKGITVRLFEKYLQMRFKICKQSFTPMHEFTASANTRYGISRLCDDFIIILEKNAICFISKLNFDGIFIANIVRFIFALFDLVLVVCVKFWVTELQ